MQKMSALLLIAALGILPFTLGACTQHEEPSPTTMAPPTAKPPTSPAATPPAGTAGVAGTWSWGIDAGGNEISQSVVLAQQGEKLTGKFTDGFDNTAYDIQDGKIRDGQVSFTVVRPFMDTGNLTLKFAGKLDGAAIKGKVEFTFGDQPNTADWNAKRGL